MNEEEFGKQFIGTQLSKGFRVGVILGDPKNPCKFDLMDLPESGVITNVEVIDTMNAFTVMVKTSNTNFEVVMSTQKLNDILS